MTIQDQYVDTLRKTQDTFRQTQETWADLVKSFTNEAQRTFGPPSSLSTLVDPNETIDQVFDFWEKSLDAQRKVAKQLVGVSISAGEKVREQAESVSALVRKNAESAGDAMRKQAAKSHDGLK
jgi:hypothetical protein